MQAGETRGGSTTPRAEEVSTSTGKAAEQVQVRPVKVRRVVIPVAIVLVVVFTVAAVLLRNTPTGAYFRVSDQVSMAALGVLLACGALLLLRPRLRAGLDGIEVRNIVSTRVFEWDEVLAISFPDGASWARLELADDEYSPVMAIQSSDGARAVQAMRDLRELRRQVDVVRGGAQQESQQESRQESEQESQQESQSGGDDAAAARSDQDDQG